MKGQYLHKKRWLSILLSVSIGLSGIVAIKPETALAAQPHWADSAMTKMAQADILKGDTDGQMHPDRPITRAEFVSMLNRAFRYDSYKDEKLPFSDMTGKEWYADNIRVAYNQGYFSGITKNKAGARDPITREQAAAMLCRNLKVDSKALQVDAFTDGRKISQWSKGSIGASVDKKYIHGYKDGSFRPQANITRGEAAAMLSNSLGTVLSKGGVQSLGTVQGNVTISGYNTALEDTVITGDLYITEGVGMGYVKLHNVTVLGEVIVCGGGEGQWGGSSVEFDDCTVAKLTIHGPADRPVAVSAIHGTRIGVTNVKSHAYIENKSSDRKVFERINLIGEENTELHVAGFFRTVSIQKPKNVFLLGRGEVENLIVDEKGVNSKVILDRKTLVRNAKLDAACEISGAGDIGSVVVAANGVKIQMLPDEIEIRPGIIANINGKDMGSLDAAESTAFPKILAGYPSAEEIEPTKAKMTVKTNKVGSIRWALTQSDAEEITKENLLKPHLRKSIIKNGVAPAKTAETEVYFDVNGLKPNVEYVVSAMLQDERGDFSTVKTEVFRAADNTKPDFQKGYPKVVSENSTTLFIDAVPVKDCKIYWAVFPQDRQAPTEYEMKKGEFDGALAFGKEENAKKNLSYRFTVTGLKEKEKYDIYVLASDGENDSKIYKLAGETKDTTPPKFLKGTPLQGQITDKSVDVRVEVDEDATVYYVVCERGADFPPPIVSTPGGDKPDGTKPDGQNPPTPGKPQIPSLDSEEAQQAVITGNNTLKNGKAAVKADVESIVKISGLEPQTAYDLYAVAVDKAKNASIVEKRQIKTKDVIPPTAELKFEDEINGKMNSEKNLQIVFSEEVWSRLTNHSLGLNSEGKPDKSQMESNFIIRDLTTGKNDVFVPIDFEKVVVKQGEKGVTIVEFPPESLNKTETNKDGGLNSGSKYQVELNEIVDTSNNAMKNGTRLPEFETVPPLVYLRMTESPQDMDITFTIDPKANKTADTTMFDIIFTTNTAIKFDIFYRKNPTDAFVNLNDIVDSGKTVPDYSPEMMKNSSMTLHYMIDKKMEPKDINQNDFHFEPFNQLKSGEYGIRFKAIEGNAEREGWNKEIEMKVRCLAGSKTAMKAVSGNPTEEQYQNALQKGVMEVHDKVLNLYASFTDTIIPKFIKPYPELKAPDSGIAEPSGTVADTLIRPKVKTDRKATMYYLIAPKNSVAENIDKKNQEQLNTLAIPIMNNSLRPEGAISGTYQIESGNVMYQPIMEGLKPETAYEVFFVLKGTPPEPSDVTYIEITTAKVAPPVIKATITGRFAENVEITLTSDKSAEIDWIIMPAKDAEQYLDKGVVKQGMEEKLKEIIRNGKESTGITTIDYGKIKTELNKVNKKFEAIFKPKAKLEKDRYYTLFAVGKMVLTDGKVVGDDSKIAVAEKFTPIDQQPPEIVEMSTVLTKIADVDSPLGASYDGQITFVFSEPLFFIKKKGDAPIPIESGEQFAKELGGGVEFTPVGKDTIGKITYEDPSSQQEVEKNALLGCTLAFTGARNKSTASTALNLCDAFGNIAGRFLITFQEKIDEDSRNISEWVFKFTQTSSTNMNQTLNVKSKQANKVSTQPPVAYRSSNSVKPKDTTPPKMIALGTTISATSVLRGAPYSGSVSFKFSEPLFYMDGRGSSPKPLTDKELINILEADGDVKIKLINPVNNTVSVPRLDSYGQPILNPDGTPKMDRIQALIGGVLQFEGATYGDRIWVNKDICDAAGNITNDFDIGFEDKNDGTNVGRQKSSWK